MAARADIDSDDGINEINVTPLVDVMLVLLVIFLVASVYIVKDAVELELPKAASATEAPETTISVVMDDKGNLYLNGELIRFDGMQYRRDIGHRALKR